LKKPLLALLVIAFSLSNILIVYTLYNEGSLAAPEISAASDGKLLVNLTSPSSLSGVTNNTNLTYTLTAENTQGANVAEVVLMFDPSVLQGVSMSENSNILLALNKHIDNSLGKITIDLALAGTGDLPADTNLVDFVFKVLDNTKNTSTVYIAQGSTLGVPNKLATSGMGGSLVNFGTIGLADTPTPTPTPTPSPTPSPTPTPTPSSAAEAICGNAILEGSEQCDDGNTTSDDGCSNMCISEALPVDNSNPQDQNTTADSNINTPAPVTEKEVVPVGTTLVTQNNRSILIIALVFTLSGTLVSLFFLIKTLVIKSGNTSQKNVNPFM